MPELPDVEIFRRHLEDTSLGRRIDDVEVLDSRILEGVSPKVFAQRLRGQAFVGTRRHGKHLLVALDGKAWLTLHFGMTGSLRHFAKLDDQPRHCRVRFDFTEDGHLGYVNVRMLGHVGLAEDPKAFLLAEGLGTDALDPAFDLAAFKALARAKARSKVKALLMDQSAIAGIGNIYSDEILFQCGLHPDMKVGALDDDAKRRLFEAIKKVLETAVEAGAGAEIDVGRLPKGFLLPRRSEEAVCPRCGTAITRIKVSGRHAYICPNCQSRH